MVFIIKIPNKQGDASRALPELTEALSNTAHASSQQVARGNGADNTRSTTTNSTSLAPADEAAFSVTEDPASGSQDSHLSASDPSQRPKTGGAGTSRGAKMADIHLAQLQVREPNTQTAPPAEPDKVQKNASQVGATGTARSDMPSAPTTLAQEAAVPAAALDVILSPPVVLHRYVRGYDTSMVVERPERIRAVLLGISAVLGRLSVDLALGAIQPASGQHSIAESGDSSDDLISAMQRLGVNTNLQAPIVRTFLCDRSLTLDPPHPAVKLVHAHEDEVVDFLESAHARVHSKKNRRTQRDVTPLAQQSSTVKVEGSEEESEEVKTGTGSHAEYVQRLSRAAPSHAPPRPLNRTSRSVNSTPAKSGSCTSATSSESDSDESESLGMRASEVPSNLNQGDLYLCGPSAAPETAYAVDDDLGGSGEAIRKALGACAEAVDRVVHAASALHGGEAPVGAMADLVEVKPAAATKTAATRPPARLPSTRAFLLTRPPGHHCTGNAPQGFCWVNNAVVAAAHAYLEHGIDRVAILDIDLHHGNGTQALAWRINADTVQSDLRRNAMIAEAHRSPRASSKTKQRKSDGASATSAASMPSIPPRGLKIFYGSIHDIESYPCENGDEGMIVAASTCIEDAHGQWIWNVHLQSYQTEGEFFALYASRYSILFDKARAFFAKTAADPRRTLVLLSTGFDACVHEHASMQRHGKHVPPAFYHRFAQDAVGLARECSDGKLISVLEGGYSDRALISATIAHIAGLSVDAPLPAVQAWWHVPELVALEKAAKKPASAARSAAVAAGGTDSSSAGSSKRKAADNSQPWLQHTMQSFIALEATLPRPPPSAAAQHHTGGNALSAIGDTSVLKLSTTPGTRALRDRSTLRRSKLAEASTTAAVAGAAGPVRGSTAKGGASATKTAASTPVAATKIVKIPVPPASDPAKRRQVSWASLAVDSPLGTPTPIAAAGTEHSSASVLRSTLVAGGTGTDEQPHNNVTTMQRGEGGAGSTLQTSAAMEEALALQLEGMSLKREALQ